MITGRRSLVSLSIYVHDNKFPAEIRDFVPSDKHDEGGSSDTNRLILYKSMYTPLVRATSQTNEQCSLSNIHLGEAPSTYISHPNN